VAIAVLDADPPQPYVREDVPSAVIDDHWHVAVRVVSSGAVIVRCRLAPLHEPVEWRTLAPEVSLDAPMCRTCLLV